MTTKIIIQFYSTVLNNIRTAITINVTEESKKLLEKENKMADRCEKARYLQGCLEVFPGNFWLGSWFSFLPFGEIVVSWLPLADWQWKKDRKFPWTSGIKAPEFENSDKAKLIIWTVLFALLGVVIWVVVTHAQWMTLPNLVVGAAYHFTTV